MFCNQLLTSLFSFHSLSRVQQSDNSCDKQLVAIDHDYHDYEKATTFSLFSFFLISIIIVTPILMFIYLNRIEYIFYA